MNAFDQRFSGIARLYGTSGLALLRAAHVCVIGIGGVGTWAVEALARSGIGALTLVDLDEICISNTNRQLPALKSTIGRSKVALMADRVREINPECHVQPQAEFFTEATANRLLASEYTYVLDAMDSIRNKCRLIVGCQRRNLPLIVSGAAGGRRDSTAVRVTDLAHASHDRLLAEVRKRLRKDHGFPPSPAPMGIECVFSLESCLPSLSPPDLEPEEIPEADFFRRQNCELGLGAATFVTGVFGFAAAGQIVLRIAGKCAPDQ